IRTRVQMPKFVSMSPTHVQGKKEYAWKKFLEGGYVALGWLQDIDMTGKSVDEIGVLVEKNVEAKDKNAQEALEAHRKFQEIQVGDYVAVTNAKNGLFGIGVITGPYEFRRSFHDVGAEDQNENYSHVRRVEWKLTSYIE